MTLPDPKVQPWLRVPEVAELYAVSVNTAYVLVANGTIPAIRLGAQWRIPTALVLRDLGLVDEPEPAA